MSGKGTSQLASKTATPGIPGANGLSRTTWSRVLLRVCDFCIAALIFVLPFIMGGREAPGHWFLISTSLFLGCTWCLYSMVAGKRYMFSWLEPLFLAGLAIVWFQTVPQSPEILSGLSGEYHRLFASWSVTQIGTDTASWTTPSLLPTETQHAWWVLLSYTIVASVVYQRLSTTEDCERMLTWIGVSGIAMTVFAIVQLCLSNDRYFWFYQHPFAGTSELMKGAFSNRNHFAQFLALAVGPLLWRLMLSFRTPTANVVPHVSSRRKRSNSKSPGRSSRKSWQQTVSSDKFGKVLSLEFLLLLCAVSMVVFTVMLSLSRGGMVATALAFLIGVSGLWKCLKLKGAVAAIILGAGVLVLGLLAGFGQDQVQTRIDQLVSADADKIDQATGRRSIWAADADAIRAFPILGTGVGSHMEVYATYMKNFADHADAVFTHAESSYLQVAMETGIVGFSCLAMGLLFLWYQLVRGFFTARNSSSQACIAVVAASAAAGSFHAFGDFIWYVPAIVVTSLTLAVVGLRVCREPGQHSGLPVPRAAWGLVAVVCLITVVQIQPDLWSRINGERHWHAYLRTVFEEIKTKQTDSEQFDVVIAEDGTAEQVELMDRYDVIRSVSRQALSPPPPASPDESEGYREPVADDLPRRRRKVQLLAASLKANPTQVRARLALAEELLRLFESLQASGDHPLPLNQIRSTAKANFAAAGELQEWALRVFGKRIALVELADHAARQCLALCPIQGKACLVLAETGFLNDPKDTSRPAIMDHVLAVRGYDPAVRFIAGRDAMLDGDLASAIRHWEMVFHSNHHFRMEILKLLAPQALSSFFIHQFHPNAVELQDILAVYDDLGRVADSQVVLQQLFRVIPEEAASLSDEKERLDLLLTGYAAAKRANDLQAAEGILRATIREFPAVYKPRHLLAHLLFETGRFQDSIQHFQWCYEQDPGNVWLPNWIKKARDKATEVALESARQSRI